MAHPAESIWRHISGGVAAGEASAGVKVGDQVQYLSAGLGRWVNAKVVKLDQAGRFQLDCKEGQWLTNTEMAGKLKGLDGKELKVDKPAAPLEGSKISVAEIVKHSTFLEQAFPQLLKRYAEVAEKGSVSWEDFRSLYSGDFMRRATVDGTSDVSTLSRRWDSKALLELFKKLDVNGSGEISLHNLIQQKSFVEKEIPEIFERWSEIDADGSETISWDEFRLVFGSVDDWLDHKLDQIVGLSGLKDKIRVFYRGVQLDQIRQKQGKQVGGGSGGETKYHMIFQGNPGTGKTTMGRIIAGLLHRVGLTPQDTLRECQRVDLVGEYAGHTAPKTKKVIESAVGGLLFVDEAYQLSRSKQDSFGVEAIEQLMAVMNEPPDKAPIMVFAGYTAEMQHFMKGNAGLYRRIAYTFDFTDYSCAELAEILERLVKKKGFELEEALLLGGRRLLADVIEQRTEGSTRAGMNGGLCERIFDYAKQQLDLRSSMDAPSIRLERRDIETACSQIKPPQTSLPDGSAGDAKLTEYVSRLQKEIERLKAENAQLRKASGGYPGSEWAGSFMPGAKVEYNSTTLQQWIPGVVVSFDAKSSTYNVAITQQIKPEVRKESLRIMELKT